MEEKLVKTKRHRIKIACARCRQQRRKCDGQKPCSNCAKRSISQCVYPTETNRKPINKKYVNSLLDQIETLHSVGATAATSTSTSTPASSQLIGDPREVPLMLSDIKVDSNIYRLLKSNSEDPNERLIKNKHDVYKLDLDRNQLLTFHGPTTFRHMSFPPVLNNPPPISEKFMLCDLINTDLYRRPITWFFQNINKEIPIIDEKLFFLSSSPNFIGPIASLFISDALVYSIMAFSLSRLRDESYLDFKKLAVSKVMEDLDFLHITRLQSLLILGLLEMGDNNEFKSSCFMSMACALSNHLGLHMNCSKMMIPKEEKLLRERVFWCVFVLDRIRYPILGVGPFLDSIDVSVKLNITDAEDPMLLFREFSILADLATNSVRCIYSLQHQIELQDHNRSRQVCAWKDAKSKLLQWEMQLPPICRIRNETDSHPNRSLLYLLQIFQDITNILINKPFSKAGFIEKYQQRDDSTADSSTRIIELCDKLPFERVAILDLVLYGLYISTLCSLFFFYDKKRASLMYTNIKKGVSLIRRISDILPVAKVYIDRIEVVKADWRVNINLEEPVEQINENEFILPSFDDIDFGSFLWPSSNLDSPDDDIWNIIPSTVSLATPSASH